VYYEHARVCVQGALNRQPGHRGARRLAGLISLNEHAFAVARDGALALISEDADDAMSWGTLSDARLELGDVPGAIEAAQRMLDLKPNLPAYGRAAHLRWLQGDIAGAKRLYELAIASGAGARDHEPRAWMITEAARVFWHEGDYRGADAGFELALREVAGYAPALEGKGRVALALGDYAAAVRWLEQALAARPLAETAWLLGDAHRLAGDERAAAAAYERVVSEHHDPRTLALFYATHAREPARALKLARAEHELRQDPYSQDALAFALYLKLLPLPREFRLRQTALFGKMGFESALLPLGEAKDPRRDAPLALFTALGLCALLYTLVQVVVIAVLPDPAASDRPLAAAAQVFLGPLGAGLMAAGALVSVYGYLAASMVNVPRLTYAMAAEGDLPPKLGAVHPRFRTPHVSVMLFAAAVWTLAAAGTFIQNLTLSAVSRLLTYGAVSVALVALRRQETAGREGVEPAWFRIPAGPAVAALGLAFSAVLALRMSQREVAVLAGTLLAGLVHWIWMRGRDSRERRTD